MNLNESEPPKVAYLIRPSCGNTVLRVLGEQEEILRTEWQNAGCCKSRVNTMALCEQGAIIGFTMG
jgi:hypothetical protein